MKNFLKRITVLFLILSTQWGHAQCAMCRAVLENEADGGAAKAINDGITFLVVWPYLLMGILAFAIWRIAKKSTNKNQ